MADLVSRNEDFEMKMFWRVLGSFLTVITVSYTAFGVLKAMEFLSKPSPKTKVQPADPSRPSILEDIGQNDPLISSAEDLDEVRNVAS
jgi:hypothetical protein